MKKMEYSEKLSLGYISQSQAQKEIIVNENFAKIDNLLNLSFISRKLIKAPMKCNYGALYLIPENSEGLWRGHPGYIAYYKGIWEFIKPVSGMVSWVQDEKILLIFDGNLWKEIVMR